MELSGARILMECLLEQGVDVVFGVPGASVLGLYDALHAYRRRIRHVLSAHEQGAAHAADGYARASGRPGVCFATSGPGVTNLVTGIATAYMDSSPVVFVSCNVAEPLIGRDAFQEVDITGIAMPVTKCALSVRRASDMADTVREAFAVARGGRPGPVLIDILKNAAAEKAEYEPLPREKHAASGHLLSRARRAGADLRLPSPDAGDVAEVAAMLSAARRPLILCGGGVVRARADKPLRALAEKLDAPVASTVMGMGAFPSGHPLATGMVGLHGTAASTRAVDGCDLLLAAGCRFSDRVALDPKRFAQQAKIVQIDIDRAEIDKNVRTFSHIVGDAGEVLSLLADAVAPARHPAWKRNVFAAAKADGGRAAEPEDALLTPQALVREACRLAPADAFVATDVGQHQMWTVQNFAFSFPGQLLTSGGFGTMGFGLGAALGAKTAFPDRCVVHFTGDGSFRMNAPELATEAREGLPVVTVVFDNGALGMVRQWQTLACGRRYSATTLGGGPDYARLAEAYGIRAARVSTVGEFRTAFGAALEAARAGQGTVIVCKIGRDELVRPTILDWKKDCGIIVK
ncbi:MAG: biosynthetic-type acetolactate synthase large subunit [Kiritimatiellae bacterium]|nr:biosynthetic-type acetolactate synthase large subunit [Kiritimatiellia bacterium]